MKNRQAMSCEMCDGTAVSMLPEHLCAEHSNHYCECLFIVMVGNHYQREGSHQQAIEQYRHALDLSPTHTNAWFQLTLLYQRRYDYANLLRYVNQWLKISPADAAALAFKGVALCMLEKYPEAVDCFERSKYFSYYTNIEQIAACYAYALLMVDRHNDALNFCNSVPKYYRYYVDIKKIRKQCRKHLGLSPWWKFWCR